MSTTQRKEPPTGVAGSDLERQASTRLSDALKKRGRSVAVEPALVRTSEGGTIALHALLALGGGLIGLKWPLIGATIILLTSFSYYAERSLGIPLIGRLIPRRASQNVLSPAPGPAWNEEIQVLLTAGYDLPSSYPTGEWLARRFSGQITTDRMLLWAGMLPVFMAVMIGAADVEGTWVGVIQLFGSAVLLAMVAAQVDRQLAQDVDADEVDMAATDNLLAVLDEASDSDDDPSIAVCFFGAERSSAKGAAEFFSGQGAALRAQDSLVINFVNGTPQGAISRPGHTPRVLVTGREGDLAMLRMNTEVADTSPIKPEAAILRAATAATVARRGGIRAISVVGTGDDAVDVGLDLIENAHPQERSD